MAPSNLFGGGLGGKACLSRLGARRGGARLSPEGRGRSGICKFLVSFVLQRPIKFLTKRQESLILLPPKTLLSGKCANRKSCGCGGIGRRAGFRCLWASARGGSTPLIRIKPTLYQLHLKIAERIIHNITGKPGFLLSQE